MAASDTAGPGGSGRVAWTMPRKPESVPEGRHSITVLARKALGYSDAADRAELCASELLTNAWEHGAGPDIEIVVTVSGGAFRVAVHDEGGTGRIVAQGQDELTGERVDNGRGLFLVAAYADRWNATQRRRQGTTVWFEIDLPVLRDFAAAPAPAGPADGAV